MCKVPDSKSPFTVNFRGQMEPRSSTCQHPAASFLLQYSIQVFELIYIRACTKTEMEAAVNRLPHPSSRTPESIAVLP